MQQGQDCAGCIVDITEPCSPHGGPHSLSGIGCKRLQGRGGDAVSSQYNGFLLGFFVISIALIRMVRVQRAD